MSDNIADNTPSNPLESTNLKSKLWAVGGGKGGIGKSIISLNLAYWLAKLNQKVVLIDADLGGANLHTLLGIKFVKNTLADYLNKRVKSLDDIAITTPIPGLRLICGASDIVGLANPQYLQKQKIIKALQNLDADHLIMDLGAGSSFNTLDFFLNCNYKIAVITPQPTALQNGYGFIKSALYRSITLTFKNNTLLAPLIDRATDQNADEPIASITELLSAFDEIHPSHRERLQQLISGFNLYLIANMVRTNKDRKAAEIIKTVIQKYLNIDHITLLGSISFDRQIEESIALMKPAFMNNTNNQSSLEFYEMVYDLIKQSNPANNVDKRIASTSNWQ